MVLASVWSSSACPPFSTELTPERTSLSTLVFANLVCSSFLRAAKFFLGPSTSRPVELASNATSSADMYLVMAGMTSARASASRRPLELAIPPWIRNPPNTIASSSGTTAMATTFHPTGQLPNDQAGGRLGGADSAPLATGAPGAASTGVVGRANIVMGLRPCYRPQPRCVLLAQTREPCKLPA